MSGVTFIIVTFNGGAYIEKCIDSIREHCTNSYILIIDNASADETLLLVENKGVDQVIKLNENLGFGKANNMGLREAFKLDAEFVFLANQDLVFKEGDFSTFLEASKDAFQSSNYAITSPLHLAPNMRDYDFKFEEYIQDKNAPNLIKNIEKGVMLDKVYEVKAVNAAAWLTTKKLLAKVGVFDPLFPHYGEDTDYINRLRYLNLKLGVIPNFKVIHDRPQTANKDAEKVAKRLRLWGFSFLKNINKSFFKATLLFPIELSKRLKLLDGMSNVKKIGLFFAITWNVKMKWFVILKHRRESKKPAAFISYLK